jgi:integrative and conjugative element protein (TIGR02256 family)
MLKVTIPRDIQLTLIDALDRAGTNECGGVLMGEHIGYNQFAVRTLTVQGGGTFASFLRGTRAALRAVKEFLHRSNHEYTRFNYLGEWHSHPSFSVQPSDTDHRSMLDIVTNPRVGANFVVLLIFKLASQGTLEGSAYTYLRDGSVLPSQLLLEGNP